MNVSATSLAQLMGLHPRVHPMLDAVVPRAEAWARAHGDLDGGAPPAKVRAWRFAALAAGMYPDADVETVALAADFTNWIAVVDDRVEKDPAQIEPLRRTGLGCAWADLERRIGRDVRAEHGALFDAYGWETGFRRNGTVPAFDEFRIHRPVSGGLPLYLRILEGACGGRPVGTAGLDLRIGNLTCWANDLLSHHWDRDGDNPINLVRVCGSIDAAVQAFADEWHGWQAECRSTPTLAQSAYVAAQPALVTGVLAWMEQTERYRASSRPTER